MRKVELQEEATQQAKEAASNGGLAILNTVEELIKILQHAKEANDMRAGEVYGEKVVLATEGRELQARLFSLSEERVKSLAILDEEGHKLTGSKFKKLYHNHFKMLLHNKYRGSCEENKRPLLVAYFTDDIMGSSSNELPISPLKRQLNECKINAGDSAKRQLLMFEESQEPETEASTKISEVNNYAS